jgi:type IV pilus assembly protein PilV
VRLPTVFSNNRGFTLIELVVAFGILMVGMLGLMESINIAMAHNLRNSLRQEAVQIGDQQLNAARALAFADVVTQTTPVAVTRNIRSISKSFTSQRTVTDLPAGGTPTSKQVQVTVTWQFKGVTYTHIVNTVITAN